MANALDINRREICDRLGLLLIAQPREGWELEFEAITRREIERLAFPSAKGKGDER